MKMKKNKAGKMQYYDSKGRYAKMNNISISPIFKSKREIALGKEQSRRDMIYNRAKNSKDKLLFETYLEIENAIPGTVSAINFNVNNFDAPGYRELDIVTKHCIIEVKSSLARKSTDQFINQKKIAISMNKTHLVYAPNMKYNSMQAYNKSGIVITRTYKELIELIKKEEK